jgi:hypothetical protein
LSPLTEREYYEIINTVTAKRSAGYDETPCFILKKVSVSVANPLIHIVNESIAQGIFPENLKKVIIVLCYKGGDKAKVEN